MIETIGWIGSVLLSTCALPLVVSVYKKKRVKDQSLLFLLWWFIGEIFLIVYVVGQTEISLPLLFNYGFNISCVMILLYFMYAYREK